MSQDPEKEGGVFVPDETGDENDPDEEFQDYDDNEVASAEFPDTEDEEEEESEESEESDESDESEDEEKDEKDDKDTEEGGDEEPKEEKGEEKSDDEKKEETSLLDQKVTFKAAGEEQTRTVGELVKEAQKGIGAENAHREAVEQRKTAEQVIEQIKKNPLDAAERLLIRDGIDEEQARTWITHMAQKRLEAALEEQQLPEEERQRRTLERQIEKKREELEQMEKESQKKRLETERLQLRDEMIRAVKSVGLPGNPVTFQGVSADYVAASQSGSPITMEEAARRYKQRLDEYVKGSYLQALPPDELKRLSPEAIAKLDEQGRRERIDKAKKIRSSKRSSTPPKARKRRGPFKNFDEARRDAQRRSRAL